MWSDVKLLTTLKINNFVVVTWATITKLNTVKFFWVTNVVSLMHVENNVGSVQSYSI